MSDAGAPDDRLTAAERRVVTLLALLRSDGVRRDPALARLVIQKLRWQLRVREALAALGRLAGAIVDAVGLLARGRTGTGGP